MVATYSTSNTVTELSPNAGRKEVIIETPTTFYGADLITLTLTDVGISETGLLSVRGYALSSSTGAILEDQPTTAVASGVLTITSSATYGLTKRVFRILGLSN